MIGGRPARPIRGNRPVGEDETRGGHRRQSIIAPDFQPGIAVVDGKGSPTEGLQPQLIGHHTIENHRIRQRTVPRIVHGEDLRGIGAGREGDAEGPVVGAGGAGPAALVQLPPDIRHFPVVAGIAPEGKGRAGHPLAGRQIGDGRHRWLHIHKIGLQPQIRHHLKLKGRSVGQWGERKIRPTRPVGENKTRAGRGGEDIILANLQRRAVIRLAQRTQTVGADREGGAEDINQADPVGGGGIAAGVRRIDGQGVRAGKQGHGRGPIRPTIRGCRVNPGGLVQ